MPRVIPMAAAEMDPAVGIADAFRPLIGCAIRMMRERIFRRDPDGAGSSRATLMNMFFYEFSAFPA